MRKEEGGGRYKWYGGGLLVGVLLFGVLQLPGRGLRVVFCDVGQGDAILLVKGSVQVLVDGGPEGSEVLACLREQMPFWDRRLELIVMTHSDKDHIGGLADVIVRYTSLYFVTGDGVVLSKEMRRLGAALDEEGVRVVGVSAGDELRVGEGEKVRVKVVWPVELKSEKVALVKQDFKESEDLQSGGLSDSERGVNKRSLVMLVEWGGYRVLLMGDLDARGEQEVVRRGDVGEIDILKLSHHGSKTGSSLELLEETRPRWAVVSAGEKNPYGHPDEEVLERVSKVGARVRRTDKEGSLVFRFR